MLLHPSSIATLNDVISSENLSGITASVYDINQATLNQQYDFILSTVVLMFLERERIPYIINNMQQYNEEVGELHKTDENGNSIKLHFATLLARKPQ